LVNLETNSPVHLYLKHIFPGSLSAEKAGHNR